MTIRRMETPEQKAQYLRGLTKDSKFDPKLHVPMLEQYSKDENADVAAAAKDLLDRTK